MKKLFFIIFLIVFLSSFSSALAFNPLTDPLVPCGRTDTNAPASERESCNFCHLFVLLSRGLVIALYVVTPLVVTLLIIYGGLTLLVAGADPSLVEKAKGILTGVFIGLVVVLGAWVFINTFLTYLGVTAWTEGKWWDISCQI